MTVVVPARNEERSIARCLGSVTAQTHRELQIIVVDAASEDRTPAIVRELAAADHRIELVTAPLATIPTSLNTALGMARGHWLVRVDAHATVQPDYVERAVAHLVTGRWGGVGGRKDGVGVTPAGRAIAAAMASRFGVGNSRYHHGREVRTVEHVPFGAYPIALLRAMGGWEERLVANEDFELDHRIVSSGSALLFDPELRIDWECRQSITDLFRQYRRYGRAKADVARLHPTSLRPRHLGPPALVAVLAAAAVVAPARPRVAARAVLPYLATVAAAGSLTASHVDAPARRFVPGAFVAMHVGWGIGFWEGALRRTRA